MFSSIIYQRYKFYVLVSGGRFINEDKNGKITEQYMIDDATECVSEFDACELCVRAMKLGFDCEVVKYKVNFEPIESVKVKY